MGYIWCGAGLRQAPRTARRSGSQRMEMGLGVGPAGTFSPSYPLRAGTARGPPQSLMQPWRAAPVGNSGNEYSVETLEQIKGRVEAVVPGESLQIVANDGVASQTSLLVDNAHALAVARFLRDDPALRLDYASNVTGIDWLDTVVQEKRKVNRVIEGVEREIEETIEHKQAGYLEVVYHLYSMELKHGPLILRLRTANRSDNARVPSLTPVWRGAEFQEREAYDLYGITFEGHPDLRRILMWDEFTDSPMRKDYVEPDDYEYEPTPHDDVLEKAREHYPGSQPVK
jgi:NADH-quinone oxidoreductase subunit C